MATPITMISPDKPTEAIKTLLTVIVERAGGEFVGIQDAFPEYDLPAYVLFIHPKYHSTLALRLDENFGTGAILKRMAECEKNSEERLMDFVDLTDALERHPRNLSSFSRITAPPRWR